ncbi:MAG: pyruvate ferredoxin oxidoreductase [Nanoarchaeota archaeon]|nr:pyruvate ferredoxin oxidoreductase [Nanoarchaeota archaeon]
MKAKALSGAESVANAMRQIDPDVVPAYPITPQTDIMHAYAKFVADGVVSGELIRVESEHSAMSAAVGAGMAGARVMTATSANGLALMWEIVYIASSLRLPMCMAVVNRALSAPINIHCDHSDSMGCRDTGWMQMYAENNQESYENMIFGMKYAEKAKLPFMMCLDGFITSHGIEPVTLFEDEKVKAFLGEHKQDYPLLDVDNPTTVGPLDLFDYYFEHKRKQSEGMFLAKGIFLEVAKDFEATFGSKIDIFEKYHTDDADTVIVAMSSTCGTAKEVVDKLRVEGRKIGLLKLRLFRPFPSYELKEVLKGKKVIAVLDRCESFGAFGGPLFSEIRSALYEVSKPKICNYIYGLGGREIDMAMIESIFDEIEKYTTADIKDFVKYLGVRE